MDDYTKQFEALITTLVESPYAIKDVPKILLGDESFVSSLLNASEKYKMFFFAYISEELKENEEFMFKTIKDSPEMLSFTNLQNNKEFFLSLMKENIEFAEHIPESLKYNKDIMFLAIINSGNRLKDAPDTIRSDKKIVLKAIESSPLMLKFASPELRDDSEVVIKAAMFNHNALIFASNRLRDDKDFALKLVALNYESLTNLSLRLRNDKKLALIAYRKNKNAIKLFSNGLINEINKNGIGKENVERYLESHVLKDELTSEIQINELKDKKLKL